MTQTFAYISDYRKVGYNILSPFYHHFTSFCYHFTSIFEKRKKKLHYIQTFGKYLTSVEDFEHDTSGSFEFQLILYVILYSESVVCLQQCINIYKYESQY